MLFSNVVNPVTILTNGYNHPGSLWLDSPHYGSESSHPNIKNIPILWSFCDFMHHWTIQVAEAWSKDGSNISSSTETRNTLVIAIQFRDQKITISRLLCFSCRSKKETGYPMLFKCLVCQCLGIRKTGLCRFELDKIGRLIIPSFASVSVTWTQLILGAETPNFQTDPKHITLLSSIRCVYRHFRWLTVHFYGWHVYWPLPFCQVSHSIH